ncbi:protein LAZY 1-like [Canna indica]|uniref:Protein LAZY 1-like n=1 Tax=Canna indica TaxID=4628 RepID=A0AAQ3KQ95_9LILI|nr:protein LAZY 1-like [Canna indica]
MKLLGWMHRKFRQNNGDVFKDYGGGINAGGKCNCLAGRPSVDDELHRRRHRQYEPFHARSLRLDVEEIFDGGSGGGDPAVEEILGGLLTIGTFGTGSWSIEGKKEEEVAAAAVDGEEKEKPVLGAAAEELVVTPAALEAIAEKEADATTETDLMVVSAELEKVLAVEAEKGGARISSARSSHAGSAACPLQGFLFGTPIEVAETMEAASAAGNGRKERRASLGELFMMSKIAEEANLAGVDGAGRHGEEKATAEMCLMKKKMAKRRGCKGSDGGSTAETKIQKILQMFHRKVHPESSIMAKKSSKTGKIEKKDYVPLIGGNYLKGDCRKEHSSFSFCSNQLPSHVFGGSDSACNKEHWIKTDADYLVLEL